MNNRIKDLDHFSNPKKNHEQENRAKNTPTLSPRSELSQILNSLQTEEFTPNQCTSSL